MLGTVAKVLLVLLLAIMISGCAVAGGIFKAGVWVGVILVLVVVGVLFAVLGRG
jgi:hypothetical protein